MDFFKGLKIYDDIINKTINDTTLVQIKQLEEKRDVILTENDLENYRKSALFDKVWTFTKKLFNDKPEAWSVDKLVSLVWSLKFQVEQPETLNLKLLNK